MEAAAELTPRQTQVVALLSQGFTNKEIARELGIGADGVKAHVSRLLLRLGARNRVELVSMMRASDPRDRALASAAGSLVDIRHMLAPAGSRSSASAVIIRDQRERLGRSITAVTPHVPADVVGRLGALRESLAAIQLAVELADSQPKGTIDQPLLDAIRARSAAALQLAGDLDDSVRLEALRQNGGARSVSARKRPVNGSSRRRS